MKILIIGGGGFQGSHLTEHWLDAGHDITVLNTPSEQTFRNIHGFEKEVRLVLGSITDREIVMKTVRGHDVVAHLAARVNVDESISLPGAVASVNVLGTQNVLDAAVEHGARVIYASSCEVYGSAQPVPVTENSGLMPHSPYAASKVGADRMCFAYHKTFGLDVTVLRPCNIYGERQKEGRGGAVVAIFARLALQGKPLMVFGSGKQTREYMHVSDVVAAYDLVLNRSGLAGETLNCGTGEKIAINDIAHFVASRMGATVQYGPDRPGEVDAFFMDSSKIRGYGFAPKVRFWEGLGRYLQWRVSQEKSLVPALVLAD